MGDVRICVPNAFRSLRWHCVCHNQLPSRFRWECKIPFVSETSALGATNCASCERPDDAPAPTPGIFDAR